MTTTIINIKVKNIRPIYSNLQDWMKNPNHEYIGRCGIVFINGERFPKYGSFWQNPFFVKDYGRDKCLVMYEQMIREKIDNEGIEELKKLKGKVLGCWCKPDKCHGDILIKLLEEYCIQ